MNEASNTFPWSLERSTSRIFEPQQQAEILGWFGREDIPQPLKEDFLQKLIDFDEGCGDFYRYRAYFLAAEALSRFPECKDGDEIVGQLLRWCYVDCQPYREWEKFPVALVRAAQQVLERTDRRRVIAAFVEQIRTVESQWMLCQIAERLGKYDSGNPTAIAALVGAIEVAKKPAIVFEATRALMAIDPGNSLIIPTLIALGKERPIAEKILWGVMRAIELLGTSHEEVVELLIQIAQIEMKDLCDLKYCWDSAVLSCRAYAIEILGRVAFGHRKAIDRLLNLITPPPEIPPLSLNPGCERAALAGIGKIAIADERAIATLSQCIQSEFSRYYRCELASALLAIEPENTLAISILAPVLDEQIEGGRTTPEEMQALLESASLRFIVADALANVESYRERAIFILRELVFAWTSYWYVPQALNSLAKIDPTLELALESVFAGLKMPLDFLMRNARDADWVLETAIRTIADWLVRSQNISLREKAIASLTEFIEKTSAGGEWEAWKRSIQSAALALGKLDRGNLLAESVILRAIEEDWATQDYRNFAFHYEDLADMGACDRISTPQILNFFEISQEERISTPQILDFFEIDETTDDKGRAFNRVADIL